MIIPSDFYFRPLRDYHARPNSLVRLLALRAPVSPVSRACPLRRPPRYWVSQCFAGAPLLSGVVLRFARFFRAGLPGGVEDGDPRDGFPAFCPKPPVHVVRWWPFPEGGGGVRAGGRARGRSEVVMGGSDYHSPAFAFCFLYLFWKVRPKDTDLANAGE